MLVRMQKVLETCFVITTSIPFLLFSEKHKNVSQIKVLKQF
jgi:hypothetical protein